jgi:hypothetical protein
VGVATLASLAGCFGSREGSSSFTARSQRLSEGNLTEAFTEQPADLSASQSALVDELVANETAVRFGNQQSEPFEDRTYVVSNGTYYLINRAEAGVETVDRDVLRAQRVNASDVAGDAVSLDSFPDSDHRPVRRTVVFAFRGQPDGYVFHSPPENTTTLRPDLEHEFVEYQDEFFRLSLTEETVDADRYEYSLTEIAADPQEFERYITSRRNITRLSSDDLTAETRAVFDDLTEGGEYDAFSPFSEAEQAMLDRLDVSQKGIGTDERKIAYDGSYYEITVSWSHGD